jgi:hypothetical protein
MSTSTYSSNLLLTARVQPRPLTTPQNVIEGMDNLRFQYRTPESMALMAHLIAKAQNQMLDGRQMTLKQSPLNWRPPRDITVGGCTIGKCPKLPGARTMGGCGLCTGKKNCKCPCCTGKKRKVIRK